MQGDVKRNKEIGAINGTWGPFFRVSFDLIIHSYVKGKGKQGWSSVLAFEKKRFDNCCNKAVKDCCENKVPAVAINKNGELRIFFRQRKYKFISKVNLGKWYNISIEQKPTNKKVRKLTK